MQGRTNFGGLGGWFAAVAVAGVITLGAAPAQAGGDRFEHAFQYEAGRLAAHAAYGAGLAVLGGIFPGPGYHPAAPAPAYGYGYAPPVSHHYVEHHHYHHGRGHRHGGGCGHNHGGHASYERYERYDSGHGYARSARHDWDD